MTQKSQTTLEELRKQFDRADADSVESGPDSAAYREITRETRDRSLSRHDQRIQHLTSLQYRLRLRLAAGLLLLLVALGGLGGYLYANRPVFDADTSKTWLRGLNNKNC